MSNQCRFDITSMPPRYCDENRFDIFKFELKDAYSVFIRYKS